MDKQKVIGAIIGVGGTGALLYYILRGTTARKILPSPTPKPTPIKECSSGDKKCIGNDLYICSNGRWVLVTKNATACGNNNAQCEDGKYMCVGLDRYVCFKGRWILSERNSLLCGYKPPAPSNKCTITISSDVGGNVQNGQKIKITAKFYNVPIEQTTRKTQYGTLEKGYFYYEIVVDGKSTGVQGINPKVIYTATITHTFTTAGKHTIYLKGITYDCVSNTLTFNVGEVEAGVVFTYYNPMARRLAFSVGNNSKLVWGNNSGKVSINYPYTNAYVDVEVKDIDCYPAYTVYKKSMKMTKVYDVNINYNNPPTWGYLEVKVINVPTDVAPYLNIFLNGVEVPYNAGTATTKDYVFKHIKPGTWSVSVKDTLHNKVLFAKNVTINDGDRLIITYDYSNERVI